jgi:hypothetical protein
MTKSTNLTNATRTTRPSVGGSDAPLRLIPHDALGSISVSPTSFAQFDVQMTRETETLINRWAHQAAPAHIAGVTRKGVAGTRR